MNVVPALEIGGTHVAAAWVDLSEPRVVAGSRPRESLDANGTSDAILATILHCAARLDAEPGAAWGIAIPGPFDYAAGIGRFEGVAKFGALNGVDVSRRLLDGLPPASQITFLNDADAFLIGEWAAGAAAGHDPVAAITLGTGIGSAFLAAGRIVDDGPDVPPGGRVDRLTIDGRPLEETASRRAIVAAYARLAGPNEPGPVPDVDEIAARARRGDTLARRAIQEPLRALGEALASWLGRFGASGLVVGGSMAGSWDLVEPALRDGLGSTLALLPARLPDDAGLIGAALYAHGADARAPKHTTLQPGTGDRRRTGMLMPRTRQQRLRVRGDGER